ncbi:site-specific integrase [Terribacillus sp. DMT04]|uniref:tyrosine-type recombinase/integrase n=1 Tax=Terribacillus sp. DMT04 TaxID=2850441 RepID=UPI001C2C0D9D|nr:site-specific integrase [Terribacillus sp. DMT04]QXE01910.1 site-specific integrase [Terribacillus sp. DMT04]
MAIEKIKENGIVVAYRSNVYYKGKRYIGTRRRLKREAEFDELEQKRDLLTGNHLVESRKTLEHGFDDYITLVAPKSLGTSALQNAESNFKKHIQPVFGFREMASIKSIEIQKFLVQKEKELANSTIIKLYTLMNQIYKMMIRWDELKTNPLVGVQKPQPNYKEKNTWTKEECHKFLSVAREYQSYMAFWLALQFGLRFSEILGLQWKNIDFSNKVLHVQQAYHEDEKKLGRLKTDASRRSIPISDQQLACLKEHKENQSPKCNIVVANSYGDYMMKRNIRRSMDRICERAEVKKITFHELRHTHATLLLEINEHVKIVQQRLGHVKAETTINIYSHVRPQVHKDSAQRFSSFFDEK